VGVKTVRDEDTGAEVRVEDGWGQVTKVEAEEGKRNAYVEIDAEHLKQYPVKAWLDMNDAWLRDIAFEALESGERARYEIHVKRKREVDPGPPLSQLRPADKFRELVELTGPRWPSRDVTVDEREAEARQKPPQEPQAAPRAAKPPEQVPEQAEAEPEAPRPSMHGRWGRGPRLEEAKPWEGYNSDGSVNLGSYAAQATIGMAALAYELAMQHARSSKGVPLEAPDPVQVQNLARRLLRCADKAQAAIRSDGHADRMDASHARARGAIRSAIDVWPPPWGKAVEEWNRWQETLIRDAAMLLAAGVALLAEPYD